MPDKLTLLTPTEFTARWEALIPTRSLLRALRATGHLPGFHALPRHLQNEALIHMGLLRVEVDGVERYAEVSDG